MYDIENDKVRGNVAKFCKQAGLFRVQFSVFFGRIDGDDLDSLKLKIEDIIDLDHDSVYLFPTDKRWLRETILLGKAFDKEAVSDEMKALFL